MIPKEESALDGKLFTFPLILSLLTFIESLYNLRWFDVKGESLGRVWVTCDESAFFHPEEMDHTEETAETQEESSKNMETEVS